jgi:ubiquinone/menaquinone biosynthesis C-methylase UbiE
MPSEPASENQPDVLRVLQSKSETKAFYDKISKIYDLMAERSEEPVRNAGLQKLAVKAGESVLEIGYGTGHCLVALARAAGPNGHVYGIDLSEGMRQQAEARLQREQIAAPVDLTCGDAAHLPYDAESLDAIFMSFTLELLDTPEIPIVLSECRRVLRPDGRIVVVGMSKEGKNGFVVHAFEWTHRHFPNFLDCRPIYVARALAGAGFTIVAAETAHMWVPVEIVAARASNQSSEEGTP